MVCCTCGSVWRTVRASFKAVNIETVNIETVSRKRTDREAGDAPTTDCYKSVLEDDAPNTHILDEDVFSQCLSVLKKFITGHRMESVILEFQRFVLYIICIFFRVKE